MRCLRQRGDIHASNRKLRLCILWLGVDGLNHRWCTPVAGLGNCMSTVLQWLADRHVRHFACGTCDIHSRGEPPRGEE